MSGFTIFIIVASIASTAYFAAGYLRGVRNAVNDYRQGAASDQKPVPQDGHWGAIAGAFLLSIISIVGIGYSPYFVYAGPILVLVTTIGVGLAFFIEERAKEPQD